MKAATEDKATNVSEGTDNKAPNVSEGTSAKQNGFVMVLIIAALGLVGVEMFILAGGSSAILFQADNAYLTACERNLVESGLVWAEKNIKKNGRETFDKSVKLDITDMSISRAALSVAASAPGNEGEKVEINACCSRGRQTFRHKKKYRLRP